MTTEAVCRAIQLRQESVRASAKRYGVSSITVQKWRKRDTTSNAAIAPKERRSSVLSLEDEAVIIADAQRRRGVVDASDLDPKAKRAVDGHIATLDAAPFGAATLVDPAARRTALWGGPTLQPHCIPYLVDVWHAVIVDVEPSTAVRQAEVTVARTMVEWSQNQHALWPERLIADTGYGSAERLG